MTSRARPRGPMGVPTDLYQHAGFLRRLAHDLVRDAHAADDVVHDAYAEALARGGRFSRAYLAATVRHKAFKFLRSRKRRAARERAAAKPETCPPASDLAAEAEIHRAVAAAVAGLDAPYRDAILLRYHHGLEPAEIAARLDVPVGTVKTRLRRGLQTLRARLDAAHGGETRSWALALVGLVRVPAPARAAIAGKLAIGSLIAATATLAIVWPRQVTPSGFRAEAQAARDEPVAAPPGDSPADAAAAAAPPPVMRWPIEQNAERPPHGAVILLRPERTATARAPRNAGGAPFDLSRARGRVEGDELVVEGLEPACGEVTAVAPDGALGWVRWSRDTNWVAPVVFGRPRSVRVRVREQDGGVLAGAPLLLKEGYTPDAEGRTDATGECTFEERFSRFGKTFDVFLGPDATLGTGWLWLGSVDPRRGDGFVDASIRPLEMFTVRILVDGTQRWPTPAELGERPDGDVLAGIDVENGMATHVERDERPAALRFRARRRRAEDPLRVWIRFRGSSDPVRLEIRGQEADCDLPLARTCAVTGTVVPPPDRLYRLMLDQRQGDRTVASRSVVVRPRQDIFRYEVSNLPRGEYRLRDEISGVNLGSFELAPGERRELPRFDLSSCAWVGGRVEPAIDAALLYEGPGLAFPWPVPVDKGRFRLRVPADRETMLTLDSETHVAEPVRVAGHGDIVIHAREGARVTMRLLRPPREDHEPTELHARGAWLARAGKAAFWRHLTVDPDTGTEGFGGLEPGRYDEIVILTGPYPWIRLRDVDIGPGVNDLGEVRVPRGSRILVRPRVPEGQGPPRLCLGARPLDHPVKVAPYVNPEATDVVALGGLGAGRWRLSVNVMHAPEIAFERDVEVDGETDVEWEIEVRR